MSDRISKARHQLSEASRRADSQLRTQLQSLDEGLERVNKDATHGGHTPRGQVLRVEEELVDLPGDAEGQTRLHIKYAMRLVTEYRRTHDFEE
jgi:hypothetical protein